MRTLSLLLFALAACASAPKESSSTSVRSDEFYALANGVPVIHVRDHSLPTVKVVLEFPRGANTEAPDEEGAVALLASLMERGAGGKSALEMAAAAENLGLEIGVSAGRENLTISGSGLKRHLPRLLELMNLVASSPNLSADELERVRRQQLARFVQERSQPSSLGSNVMLKKLYGADRQGRPVAGTAASVKGVSKGVVDRLFAQIVGAGPAVIGLFGDLDIAEAKPMLQKAFGQWKAPATLQPSMPLNVEDGPRVHVVHKAGLSQATVILAHGGLQRTDPRWETVQVMNFILGGGGFSSRLMKLVRSEKGLTYGIRSRFAGGARGGPFTISAATRNEKVRELIDLSMQVVDDLRQNGVSEEDLNQAKNYLLGSFPLRLETPEGEGSYLMMARRYGLGDDYLAAYPERVKAVTRTAVSMAASELLDTSRLRIIVVGPREALYDQLKDLGDVTASDWQDDSAIPPNP